MTEQRPLILIVNDDGIQSPGLHAAAEVGLALGDILVVAPVEQQTAMGRSRPHFADSGIIRETELKLNGQKHIGYAVTSTPALCVAHALIEIAPRKPDLCLSGINYGENIGFSITVSGTLGAALEAASFNVPAIAASLETPLSLTHAEDYAELDWDAAKHHLQQLAAVVLARGIPEGVSVLNINIPSDATTETAQRITQVSTHNYYNFNHVGPASRAFNQPHRLPESRIADKTTLEPDSDIYAFAHDRVVSVSPIVRNFTAPLDLVRDWTQSN